MTTQDLFLVYQDNYFYLHGSHIDLIIMNPPGGVSLFLFGFLILMVASCAQRNAGSLRPEGYEAHNILTVEQGDLKAVFVDNSAVGPRHRAGYNGIAQLYHSEEDSGIFVPEYAGFNLEHVFAGDSLYQLFEPRLHPMTLFRKTDDEVLLYQEATPLSGVESLTSFKVVPPHYIDVTFECLFHDEDFFRHGYAGLFWASYIYQPEDKKIYFQGVGETGMKENPSWIAAYSEEHGVNSTHKRADDDHDFFFAENFNARLASHFSTYRYTRPFFFGRYKNMVLGFFLNGDDVIRFSQSPTGGGELNPAWDFQYLIPSPEKGKKYSFRARIVYKPFVNENDILEEFDKWRPKK